MISLLSELGPRHEAVQQTLKAQIPVDQEIRSFWNDMDYVNRIWELTQTYNRTFSGDREALSAEYQSIQDYMISYVNKLPPGSDGDHLATELADVWAAMHQQENQAKR